MAGSSSNVGPSSSSLVGDGVTVAMEGIPKGQTYKLPIVERVKTAADVEAHNRKKYASDTFRTTNTPSNISEGDVELLKTEFYIPKDYKVRKPKDHERMYWHPE